MNKDLKLNIDGMDIAYRYSGCPDLDAPVAVILQGWGTYYSLYDSMAASIGDVYRVLQFDLPGFGASSEPTEAWSVSDYAEFFVRFMKAMDITKCILIGHSYGGRVIIKLTAARLNFFEIDKIILVDSAGVLPIRTPKQKRSIARYKLLKKIAAFPPIYYMFSEYIDDWKGRQGSEDYRLASPVMKQTMVKAVNEDLTGLLHDIPEETLLVWGDMDTATPMRDAHIMEQEIPNAGLAVIQGTGHFSYAEKPDVFRNIIRSFLGLDGR